MMTNAANEYEYLTYSQLCVELPTSVVQNLINKAKRFSSPWIKPYTQGSKFGLIYYS